MIFSLFSSALLLFTASPTLAQTCKGSSCTREEVGAFLMDVQAKCINSGDCSLADIMTVVNNVGIYILGIVGSLVLLMYVIGGFFMLTARGNPEQVTKGKTILIRATIGLVIVFAAFAAIQTVESVLRSGQVTGGGSSCAGQENGTKCGDNMRCQGGSCLTKCEIDKANDPKRWACIDLGSVESASAWDDSQSCESGKCPGGDEIQCCPLK